MTEFRRGPEGPLFHRRFVNRFLATLLVILAAGAAIQFLAFLFVFRKPLPPAYSAVHYALRELSGLLAPMIAFSAAAYALLMGIAVAVLCIGAFHGIAGPVFRMEAAIENLGSGEPVKAVFLRERDQLAPLGKAFNGFVSRLRKDRQEWIEAMEQAEQLCLRDPAVCRQEKEAALGRLSGLLTRYR